MLSLLKCGLFLVKSGVRVLGFGRRVLPWLLLVCVSASAAGRELRIAISNAGAVNDSEPSYYFEQLLQLALAKTSGSDGPFKIVHNHHGGGIERDRALLVSGVGIDVMWGSVTRDREAAMRVIPVDLLKALNNYRVLLIRRDNQAAFNSIKTLADLRTFTMGSGVRWTDTEIMSNNGFNIVDGSNYSGLFKMLAAGRFDFMSRGVHEVGYDMAVYASMGLTLEEKVLLKYSLPLQYSFYVNKNNLALAERLERGLKMAQEDGSFDRLFYQIPSLKKGMDLFNSSSRTLFQLQSDAVLYGGRSDCCGDVSRTSKHHP